MWRGLPEIPHASLKVRKGFSQYDAQKKFGVKPPKVLGEACGPECPLCGEILRGLAEPAQCDLFGKSCTPQNPIGACMVSTEGTCNVAYRYGNTILE